MSFTAEDQHGLIALLESLGEWAWADKLRDLKLAGRPRRRVNGVTPLQDEQFRLRDRIITAGGEVELFLDDPLVPCATEDERSEYLERLVALEGSRLRRAHKIWIAQKNGGQKVPDPADDDFSDV